MKTDSEVNNISLAVKKLYLCRLIISLITLLTKKNATDCDEFYPFGAQKQMNLKKEKEKLYSRNFIKYGLDLNVSVSVITAVLALAFSIFTIVKPTVSAELFANTNTAINKTFYWLYAVNALLIFLLFIGFSKFDNIIGISKLSLLRTNLLITLFILSLAKKVQFNY